MEGIKNYFGLGAAQSRLPSMGNDTTGDQALDTSDVEGVVTNRSALNSTQTIGRRRFGLAISRAEQALESIALAAERTLNLQADPLAPPARNEDLQGRVSSGWSWMLAELRSDFLPEDGFSGLTQEIIQWTHYGYERFSEVFPSMHQRLQQDPPPIQLDDPNLALDLRVSLPVLQVSDGIRELADTITISAKQILYGDRHMGAKEQEVCNTLHRILVVSLGNFESQKVVRRFLEEPELFKRWLDRILPGLERLSAGIDSKKIETLTIKVVKVLVATYPLEAIKEVEKGTQHSVAAKQKLVLEKILKRTDVSGASSLHPVLMSNLEGDITLHRQLVERHLEASFLRLFRASLAGKRDHLAVRLNDHLFEDLALQTAARGMAVEIWDRLDRMLSGTQVGAMLEKLVRDSLYTKSESRKKRRVHAPLGSAASGQVSYLPGEAQKQLMERLLPDLCRDILGGGSAKAAKVGLRLAQGTLISEINKGLNRYLEVSPEGRRQVKSDALYEQLQIIEDHLNKVRVGTSVQEDQFEEQLSWLGSFVNKIIDVSAKQNQIQGWITDYRLAFDNILLQVVDTILIELFPDIKEQNLVDRLESPVIVSAQRCMHFQRLVGAQREFKEWIPILSQELTWDKVWNTLGERDQALVTSLGNLQQDILRESRQHACEELAELFEIASGRREVQHALQLSQFQVIYPSWTHEVRQRLLGKDYQLAQALIDWRIEGTSAVDLVERAHEWLFLTMLSESSQIMLTHEEIRERLYPERDMMAYFSDYKNFTFQEIVQASANKLRVS